MSQLFLIADTHFGEEEILHYENRPFADLTEMDREMVRRWNEVVNEDDIVYHLGDFSVKGKEKHYLDQLNGRVILVKGNHDTLTDQEYRNLGFLESYAFPIIVQGFWIFSHEPLYVNENMPYANLFGHVHGSPLYRDFSSHHYCVSAERIGYRPMKLEEVKKRVREGANGGGN